MNNSLRIVQWSKGGLSLREVMSLPQSIHDQALEMLKSDRPKSDSE